MAIATSLNGLPRGVLILLVSLLSAALMWFVTEVASGRKAEFAEWKQRVTQVESQIGEMQRRVDAVTFELKGKVDILAFQMKVVEQTAAETKTEQQARTQKFELINQRLFNQEFRSTDVLQRLAEILVKIDKLEQRLGIAPSRRSEGLP